MYRCVKVLYVYTVLYVWGFIRSKLDGEKLVAAAFSIEIVDVLAPL
jgi:hypothetical protein